MDKTENKNNLLKQHTALTNFKIEHGNYFPLLCEKIVFFLLKDKQNAMQLQFYSEIDELLNKIFINVKFNKEIIEQIYKNNLKIEDITNDITINNNELKIFYNKVNEFNKMTESTYKKLSPKQREFCDLLILKIDPKFEFDSFNTENFSKYDILNIVQDIKTYARQHTIMSASMVENIDLTQLSQNIGITNITVLKKHLTLVEQTKFLFNYFNKKKLNIELTVPYISNISFASSAGRGTVFSYSVPLAILSLNLLPEIYAPLDALEIQKITGKYTYRLYSLLKDHILRGSVQLTKEELQNWLMISDRTISNASTLKKNVLDPAIAEINIISNMNCSYELIPPRRFQEIKFSISVNKEKIIETVKVKKEHDKNDLDYRDNELIVKSINKAKRNIYVSKSWNKRVENKLNKIYNEIGEKFTIELLNDLYDNLNSEIEVTLVAYINGILKNKKIKIKPRSDKRGDISSEVSENKKQIRQKINEKLDRKKQISFTFSESSKNDIIKSEKTIKQYNNENALKYYYSLSLEKQKKLEEIFLPKCSEIKKIPIDLLLKIKEEYKDFYNENILEFLTETLNEQEENKKELLSPEQLYEDYINLDSYSKLKIEEEALYVCSKEIGADINFLLAMKTKTPSVYEGLIKEYIVKAMLNRE